jgi:hypothetical protein
VNITGLESDCDQVHFGIPQHLVDLLRGALLVRLLEEAQLSAVGLGAVHSVSFIFCCVCDG